MCVEPQHIHIRRTSATGTLASSMTLPSSALDMRPTTSLLAWALSKGRSAAAVCAATSAPEHTACGALVAPPASPLRVRRECAMGSLLRAASPAPAQLVRLRAGGRGPDGKSAGACGSGAAPSSCDNVSVSISPSVLKKIDFQINFFSFLTLPWNKDPCDPARVFWLSVSLQRIGRPISPARKGGGGNSGVEGDSAPG